LGQTLKELKYLNILDDFYANYYSKIFGSGLVGKIAGFVHWLIEYPYKQDRFFSTVLEVGAGEGQHFKFIKHNYNLYIENDIRESIHQTFSNQLQKNLSNAEDLDGIESNSVDRLIATCLLVHLLEPEKALQNWSRVVKKGGQLNIFVPVEPSILLRFFRFFVTSRKAKKFGLDHKAIHYREHRNMWIFCDLLIRETFHASKIRVRKFPTKLLPWNLRLFDIYEITK
jgi:phosphatidylethanolamine/phosphatidyl-N-methylethanolamine N-methyltransferase